MKTRYRFIGLSSYGKNHLFEEDTLELMAMIGCEVEESENPSIVDGKRMFIMPDGGETHIDYLQLEQLQPELSFEKQT